MAGILEQRLFITGMLVGAIGSGSTVNYFKFNITKQLYARVFKCGHISVFKDWKFKMR